MVKSQMLLQFEKELAQAVEALTKEQEKAAQAEREKQSQVVICIIHLTFMMFNPVKMCWHPVIILLPNVFICHLAHT